MKGVRPASLVEKPGRVRERAGGSRGDGAKFAQSGLVRLDFAVVSEGISIPCRAIADDLPKIPFA
jgi:hypothetical protein